MSLVCEGIKCRQVILWPSQLRTIVDSWLGYKHTCVNYLHIASHDYQVSGSNPAHPHIHSLTKSFYFFSLAQLPPLFQHQRFCGHSENDSRIGYKHVCVNYLHMVSHDYQEVIQHTHTHPHTHKIILFLIFLISHSAPTSLST